jgi:Ca-activated chloride channel family protein
MKSITTFLTFATLLLATSHAFAIGLLIPNDDGVRPFDVERHRATVTITNNAAVTTVEQIFRNHTNRPMEAVFVFPIPEGGTVSDFSLWIEGKKTKGAVLETDQARAIYERIVRRTEDPGLVEYMDGKLFRASIFPIPPNGTQKLEIKFGQVLQREGGMYRFTYPVAAGRKYVAAKTAKDFTVAVTLNSSIPINSVYSPSHTIGTTRKSDGKVIVGTEEMHAELDRDFNLYVSYSKQDIGLSFLSHDPDGPGGEDGYVMLALAPRVEAPAHDEAGQTFTFVMDTSGSMAGDKIEQARETLTHCIEKLRPQDNFNVIRFSTAVEPFRVSPVKATNGNKAAAIEFATELRAAGGTAIHDALVTALEQKTPRHQPHQVIFVTDGTPTVGPGQTDEIVGAVKPKVRPNTRIFTFGVGYEVNAILLDNLASVGRGRPDYVKPEQDIRTAVSALYTRISAPVLSNIKLDDGGMRLYDAYPNPLPDLFRGDQIVIFGRYKRAPTRPIVVSGNVGDDERTFRFGGGGGDKPLALDASSEAPLEFMPKLWATRKVGFLLEQIRLNGEQKELKDEVITLARRFGLVTPYTSFLAVDDSELEGTRPDTRPRPRPRPEPTIGGDVDFEEDSLSGSFNRPRRSAGGAPAAAPIDERAFAESTGETAVAASEATREYKEADKLERDSGSTRWLAGRTFTFSSGTWVQEGASEPSAKKVKAFSKTYFALLKKHPELKKVVALGNVVVKVGGKTYRFEK